MEFQQQHVNSLSHMVVVVDESENENATADLEEQLAVLGERWSAVCKWTEQRYVWFQLHAGYFEYSYRLYLKHGM